ncbi:AuaD protein [Brevibacillus humidisoli]|uniref:beta-ketoacyl-[acyl-carrier-protein] synthase family protein n=1 Tax=Brevibacillus humidisoli TaxID=2895522 RepID=UPI001E617966|nr:beta-ketoacyl synthase N-terminal-like domain-containing protein [Brevibacillus humidisoli]UFJ42567.1 AuaD protein [Brevibacillus humidisoli]
MSNQAESIAITGIGAVSAYGLGVESLWSAIGKRVPRKTLIHDQEAPESDVLYGLQVGEWNPAELLGKRGLQFLRPSTKYLHAASLLALQDAKLSPKSPDPDEVGIVVGSNLAGLQSITEYDLTAVTEGPQYVSPMEAPNTLANAPASHLAIRVQARAFNTTIASGQCAGFDALGYASKMLREKRARYVIVGGVEELNPRVMWVYRNAGVLPKDRPEDAGKPYRLDSTGWLPGEGAAVLILERKEDAQKRGAKILAELLSWSSSFAISSSPEKRSAGLERAIRDALVTARINPNQVDLVLSGANGLVEQDRAESLALRTLFADHPDVPVLPAKETLGECYGASGTFQSIAAVCAINEGTIPAAYRIAADEVAAASNMQELPGGELRSGSQRGTVLLTSQDLFGSASAVVLAGSRE